MNLYSEHENSQFHTPWCTLRWAIALGLVTLAHLLGNSAWGAAWGQGAPVLNTPRVLHAQLEPEMQLERRAPLPTPAIKPRLPTLDIDSCLQPSFKTVRVLITVEVVELAYWAGMRTVDFRWLNPHLLDPVVLGFWGLLVCIPSSHEPGFHFAMAGHIRFV